MQGKKRYQEKLFNEFRLIEQVPEHNFYRRLKDAIELRSLYPLTKGYYGESDRKSIDPVEFGTLTQFMGLRKINTIGLAQAKVMHLSAIAYNLRKYLKFDQRRVKSGAGVLVLATLVKRTFRLLFGAYIRYRKLTYNF